MPTPGLRLSLLCSLAACLLLSLSTPSAQATELPGADLLDGATRSYLEAGHVAEAIESHARYQQRRGETPTAATFLAALLEVETLPRERGGGEPADQDEADSTFRAQHAAERVEENLFRYMRNRALLEVRESHLRQLSEEVESYLEDLQTKLLFLRGVFGSSVGEGIQRPEAYLRAEFATVVGEAYLKQKNVLSAASYFAYSVEQRPLQTALLGLSALHLSFGDLETGVALLLYGKKLQIEVPLPADLIDEYYSPATKGVGTLLASPDVEMPQAILDHAAGWREYVRLTTGDPEAALLEVRELLANSVAPLEAEPQLIYRAAGCHAVAELRAHGRAIPSGPQVDMTEETRVSPPRKLYAPFPQYTERARQARIQGQVVVEVILGPDGCVESGKVEESLAPDLDAVALETVRGWIFEPAKAEGVPVRVYYNVTVNFRLR